MQALSAACNEIMVLLRITLATCCPVFKFHDPVGKPELCIGNQRTHIFERRCIAVASSALALASELRRNRLCSDIVRTSKSLAPACFSETVLDATVSQVCHIRACDSGYRDKRDTVNNVGQCIVGCSIRCRESAAHAYGST